MFVHLQCIIDYCGQVLNCQEENTNNNGRTQCSKNDDKPTVETKSEIAIFLAVLVIFLGIPLMKFLLNCLRKLVLKVSNNFQEDEHNQQQQQYELSSLRLNNRSTEELSKILKFLKYLKMEAIERFQNFENGSSNNILIPLELEESFKIIHKTKSWKNLVPLFVDIAGPLFDANPGQMDEYFKLLYWLDEAQHKNNVTDMLLCFKHYTGNLAVVPILWAAERHSALKSERKCNFEIS